MTIQITVGCAPGSTEHFASQCRSVWATLPGSLAPAEGDVEVVAIDGTRTNWLDTLESMITGGIAGAVVVAPSLCDTSSVMVNRLERLRRWGEEECIPVVVDSHWSASLAALSSEQLLAPDSVLVESVAVCEPGAEGDHRYPTTYESPPTSSWRRVHHAVTSGTMTDDLARLVQVIRLSRATLAFGLAL